MTTCLQSKKGHVKHLFFDSCAMRRAKLEGVEMSKQSHKQEKNYFDFGSPFLMQFRSTTL